MAAQYLHHPYRLPVIGWFHEIAGYTREDAVDFYRQWYAPNNAVLVVAGDITAAELRPLAERTYGQIPARPVPARHRLVEPPQHAERRVVAASRAGAPAEPDALLPGAQLQLARATSMPMRWSVLAEILGGGGTSRLYRARGGRAGAGGRCRCLLSRQQPRCASFRVYASPRPGVDMAELEAAVGREIDRILADGVTEDELARTQRRLLAEAIYARDSLGGAARAFGVALTTRSSGRGRRGLARAHRRGDRRADPAAARHVLAAAAVGDGTAAARRQNLTRAPA